MDVYLIHSLQVMGEGLLVMAQSRPHCCLATTLVHFEDVQFASDISN